MSVAIKLLGAALVIVGLIDLVGSYADFDLWGGFVGIELPELLWKYSAYIEMALGYFLFKFSANSIDSEEAETESA